jgi:rRNA maturation endonuclease Nob1
MKNYPKIFIEWSKECQGWIYTIKTKNKIRTICGSNARTKREARKQAKEDIRLNSNYNL